MCTLPKLTCSWKQRDIHEKREQRKLHIAKLHSEIALNAVLRPRIQSVLDGTRSKGLDHYRAVQRRVKESPSDEKPATGAPNQPTYDMMLGQLLGDVFKEGTYMVDGAVASGWEVKVDGKKVDDKTPLPSWAEGVVPDNKVQALQHALESRLEWHLAELDRRDADVKKEIEQEEAEQKKKITSEGIKEGWSATSVAAPKPSPLDDKPKTKTKQKEKTETIEVLNPGASVSCVFASW
jgi:cell division cycle protein 37